MYLNASEINGHFGLMGLASFRLNVEQNTSRLYYGLKKLFVRFSSVRCIDIEFASVPFLDRSKIDHLSSLLDATTLFRFARKHSATG
jgi:hypothetical protein